MILRRMIDHVKHQNWTAVVLDFIIVVFGVFIGIQVSNWNTARIERAEKGDLLTRMASEAEAARAGMAEYRALHADISRGARELAVRLNEAEDCLAMDESMTRLMLGVGDFPPPRFSLAAANEALDTGRLALIESVEIRDGVQEMIDEMTFLDRQWQRYKRIKQDTEQSVYKAAGLSLAGEQDLKVLPGEGWDGIEQYRLMTPEGVCGNREIVALVSNAAVTQHIYSVYTGQVADTLERYAGLLSGYAEDGQKAGRTAP